MEPLSDVGAMALSGSGKELAIVIAPSLAGEKSLCVYSVATGDPLHCWSTDDRTVFMGSYVPGTLSPSLTWIDGDKAIAFPTLGNVRLPHSNQFEARQTVRSLNLKSKGANLMTDSQVIWSQSPASPNANRSVRRQLPDGQRRREDGLVQRRLCLGRLQPQPRPLAARVADVPDQRGGGSRRRPGRRLSAEGPHADEAAGQRVTVVG